MLNSYSIDRNFILINSFATECFANIADKDYISARLNYRLGLMEQFLWSGLQAIEKYLKGILLYNGRSAKCLGHNIMKALDHVKGITEINFSVDEKEAQLINNLNRFGENRYLEREAYTMGDELLILDKTVWSIRRYCKVLNYSVKMLDGSMKCVLQQELNSIKSEYYQKNPHKLRNIGGYLESVLDRPRSDELRKALVWKNCYFGSRKKHKVKDFVYRHYSVIPPHFRRPESFPILSEFIHFPAEISRLF